MHDWAIVVLGIPLGSFGIFFGWLFSRQYFKVVTNRQELKRQELALQEKELKLRDKLADQEFEFRERELEYKFKMLEAGGRSTERSPEISDDTEPHPTKPKN